MDPVSCSNSQMPCSSQGLALSTQINGEGQEKGVFILRAGGK